MYTQKELRTDFLSGSGNRLNSPWSDNIPLIRGFQGEERLVSKIRYIETDCSKFILNHILTVKHKLDNFSWVEIKEIPK